MGAGDESACEIITMARLLLGTVVIENRPSWALAHADACYGSDQGRCLCFYGQMYNQAELEAEWQLPVGSSNCAELMIKMLDRYGPQQALEKVNGPFALAYFDGAQVLLARDHFGIMQLYYSVQNGHLLFSTRLKAMTGYRGFSKNISPQALNAYFKFNFIPADMCIYDNVHKLPAGRYLRQDSRAQTQGSFFSPVEASLSSQTLQAGDGELASEFAGYLRQAVQRRFAEQEKVNLLLSGGVDSALVAAILSERGGLSSLTIGFDEKGFSEIEEAALIAARLGIEHNSHVLSGGQAAELVPELGGIYEEPYADQSQLATLLAFKMARPVSTHLWLGDGGDELYIGYKRQLQHARYALDFHPASGRLLFSSFKKAPLNAAQAFAGLSYKGNYLERLITNPDYRKVVLKPQKPGPRVDAKIFAIADPYKRAAAFDMIYFLADGTLVKGGQLAQALSMRTCLPLLDVELFKFSQRLPLHLLVHDNMGKIILRKVLEKYLPREWINRPKKGFQPPVGHWLQRELAPWAKDMLDDGTIRRQRLLNLKMVRYYWDTLPRKGSSTNRLWAILMLQSWLLNNGF